MQASSEQIAAFRYGVVSAFTLLIKARCITDDTLVMSQLVHFSATDLKVYDITMFDALVELLSTRADLNLLAASMHILFAHHQLSETTQNE